MSENDKRFIPVVVKHGDSQYESVLDTMTNTVFMCPMELGLATEIGVEIRGTEKESKTIGESMTFPTTAEEFMERYKVTDSKQIYSNGIEYVPIFRMRQWFEHQVDLYERTGFLTR